MGGDLIVEHRAFPLRPTPAENVPFKGTYREAGWQRCNQMSAGDGVVFNPWPHAALPGWSLPALEAAKCVAKQGEAVFERVHIALYEAFFTRSLNIADPSVLARIVAEHGADPARFTADREAAFAREAVLARHAAPVRWDPDLTPPPR